MEDSERSQGGESTKSTISKKLSRMFKRRKNRAMKNPKKNPKNGMHNLKPLPTRTPKVRKIRDERSDSDSSVATDVSEQPVMQVFDQIFNLASDIGGFSGILDAFSDNESIEESGSDSTLNPLRSRSHSKKNANSKVDLEDNHKSRSGGLNEIPTTPTVARPINRVVSELIAPHHLESNEPRFKDYSKARSVSSDVPFRRGGSLSRIFSMKKRRSNSLSRKSIKTSSSMSTNKFSNINRSQSAEMSPPVRVTRVQPVRFRSVRQSRVPSKITVATSKRKISESEVPVWDDSSVSTTHSTQPIRWEQVFDDLGCKIMSLVKESERRGVFGDDEMNQIKVASLSCINCGTSSKLPNKLTRDDQLDDEQGSNGWTSPVPTIQFTCSAEGVVCNAQFGRPDIEVTESSAATSKTKLDKDLVCKARAYGFDIDKIETQQEVVESLTIPTESSKNNNIYSTPLSFPTFPGEERELETQQEAAKSSMGTSRSPLRVKTIPPQRKSYADENNLVTLPASTGGRSQSNEGMCEENESACTPDETDDDKSGSDSSVGTEGSDSTRPALKVFLNVGSDVEEGLTGLLDMLSVDESDDESRGEDETAESNHEYFRTDENSEVDLEDKSASRGGDFNEIPSTLNRVVSELFAPSHSESQLTPKGINYIVGDEVEVKLQVTGNEEIATAEDNSMACLLEVHREPDAASGNEKRIIRRGSNLSRIFSQRNKQCNKPSHDPSAKTSSPLGRNIPDSENHSLSVISNVSLSPKQKKSSAVDIMTPRAAVDIGTPPAIENQQDAAKFSHKTLFDNIQRALDGLSTIPMACSDSNNVLCTTNFDIFDEFEPHTKSQATKPSTIPIDIFGEKASAVSDYDKIEAQQDVEESSMIPITWSDRNICCKASLDGLGDNEIEIRQEVDGSSSIPMMCSDRNAPCTAPRDRPNEDRLKIQCRCDEASSTTYMHVPKDITDGEQSEVEIEAPSSPVSSPNKKVVFFRSPKWRRSPKNRGNDNTQGASNSLKQNERTMSSQLYLPELRETRKEESEERKEDFEVDVQKLLCAYASVSCSNSKPFQNTLACGIAPPQQTLKLARTCVDREKSLFDEPQRKGLTRLLGRTIRLKSMLGKGRRGVHSSSSEITTRSVNKASEEIPDSTKGVLDKGRRGVHSSSSEKTTKYVNKTSEEITDNTKRVDKNPTPWRRKRFSNNGSKMRMTSNRDYDEDECKQEGNEGYSDRAVVEQTKILLESVLRDLRPPVGEAAIEAEMKLDNETAHNDYFNILKAFVESADIAVQKLKEYSQSDSSLNPATSEEMEAEFYDSETLKTSFTDAPTAFSECDLESNKEMSKGRKGKSSKKQPQKSKKGGAKSPGNNILRDLTKLKNTMKGVPLGMAKGVQRSRKTKRKETDLQIPMVGPRNDLLSLDSFQEKEEETLDFCSSNFDKDAKNIPLHHFTPSSPKAINPKDVVEKKKGNSDANESLYSQFPQEWTQGSKYFNDYFDDRFADQNPTNDEKADNSETMKSTSELVATEVSYLNLRVIKDHDESRDLNKFDDSETLKTSSTDSPIGISESDIESNTEMSKARKGESSKKQPQKLKKGGAKSPGNNVLRDLTTLKNSNKRVQLGMAKGMQQSSKTKRKETDWQMPIVVPQNEEPLDFCSSNFDKDAKKFPLHHSTPSSPKAINPKDVVKEKKDNSDANESFHSHGWEDFEDPFDFESVNPFWAARSGKFT